MDPKVDSPHKVTQPESAERMEAEVPVIDEDGFSSQAQTVSKDVPEQLDQQEQEMLF